MTSSKVYFELLFDNSTLPPESKMSGFSLGDDQQDPREDDEAMTMSSTTGKKDGGANPKPDF